MGFMGDLLFGKRKQYNADVDALIKYQIKIETNYGLNSHFGGIIFYLSLIDRCWYQNISAEEAAICIATSYYTGMLKSDTYSNRIEARELCPRIMAFIAKCLSNGIITTQRSEHHVSILNEYSQQYSYIQ